MASPAVYDRRRLTRSPLINTIWQVRFTSGVDLADGRAALALKNAIRRDLTLTPVEAGDASLAARVVPGANQDSPNASASGWRLSAADGSAVVTLARGVLTVETAQYQSWEEVFLPWVSDALRALGDVMAPGLMTRMGLRYVNAIFGPTLDLEPFRALDEMRSFVDPSLLGLGSLGDVGEADVIQGRQVFTQGAVKIIVNHAVVQSDDGQTGLLIDVDVFDDGVVEFGSKDAHLVADTLHDVALVVFQRTITAEALEKMGPKGDAN